MKYQQIGLEAVNVSMEVKFLVPGDEARDDGF